MKNNILEDCLRQSIKLNYKHPEKHNGYHHFSFIIQNNTILGHGFNRGGGAKPLIGYKSHQKLHSENTVYFKVKGILENRKSFEMINIRLTKQNELRISRPCECCISFLFGLGCSCVFFTTGLVEYQWAKINLH